jgi:glyoxylase-like metal-dependent hydrolase (beta-lactamase superfamily II)
VEALLADGYRVELREQEPGLVGLGCMPSFAIGQRALLVATPAGNLLWDCVSVIDEASVARVTELGGIGAIACSHPHFHGAMVEWAHTFGAELLVPEADLGWVQRPDPAVRTWSDRLEVLPGLTLVQCGGHFDGSAVLHWTEGAGGRGALLVGDTATVTPDRNLSFMRSYPNLIPLPPRTVREIAERLLALEFDRVYGGWWERVVPAGGRQALRRSAERYQRWVRS